jgi:hypothetical protein
LRIQFACAHGNRHVVDKLEARDIRQIFAHNNPKRQSYRLFALPASQAPRSALYYAEGLA